QNGLVGSISSTNAAHANSSSTGHAFCAILILVCRAGKAKAGSRVLAAANTLHLMNVQSKLRILFSQPRWMPLRAHRQNFLTRYPLSCKGTPCDRGGPFPIIPRISSAAGALPASFSAKFPVTNNPGCTGTKSQYSKFHLGEWE